MLEMVPLVLLAPVLIAVGYSDLRNMKIPNLLPLVSVGLFVATAWPFAAGQSLFQRAEMAALFLGIGLVTFALRVVGGGDVKMLAALQLFIPPATFSLFMLVFSAALLVGISLVYALRMAPAGMRHGWKGLQPQSNFPMGISIALAGLLHPVVVYMLHRQGLLS